MTGGWIKLHRQTVDCAELQDPYAIAVWVRLLLRAARRPTRVHWRGVSFTVETGQLVVSIREFAAECQVSYQRVRTILQRFVTNDMLKINAAPNAMGSLLTICRYEAFQLDDTKGNAEPNAVPTQYQRSTNAQNKKGRRGEGIRKEESETLSPTKESPATKPVAGARSRGSTGYQSDFEQAWTAYPLRDEDKHDKRGCYRLWQTAIRTSDAEAITASAREWCAEQSANPFRIGLRRWLKDKHYLHQPPVYRAGDGEHSDVIEESTRQTLDTIAEMRRRKANGHQEFTGTYSCLPERSAPDIRLGIEDEPGEYVESEWSLH